MLTTIIEDMEGNVISKQTYIKDYPFNNFSFKKKRRKIEFNPSFFDELDFSLGVLAPDMNLNDFLICFLNKPLLDYFNIDLDEVKGAYLFESLDFLNDFNVKDLLFDSYANNQDVEFKILRYVENIMVSSRVYKFFRFNDKLYFKITNSDDLDILNKSNKETIENSNLSVGIIQANKWVYGNRTFCRMNDVDESSINELEIFNRNIISREFASVEELKYILDDILNRRLFFFQDNLKFNFNGEIRHLREFIYPTSFNNQPAIEVIFIDQTKEKRLKKEFADLNRKNEIILKLGKLAVCQVKDGRIYWSNEIFSIFEIPPNELEFPAITNCIEEFFDIIKDFIIKTDLASLYDEINSQKDESSKLNLNFRIKTRKGNIKFINCEFILYGEDPLTLTGFVQDISYEESLKNELNYQLREYEKLYGELQQSRKILEEELENKSLVLEYIYNKFNLNLKIFLYLLGTYLDSNPKISDSYYRMFKKRIEILCRDNVISQSSEYYEQLSLRDFMNIFINDYYSKLFKSSIVNCNIEGDILFYRDEIDLIYLILCEFFIIILKMEETDIERLDIEGYLEDDSIRISIKAFNYERIDLQYLKVLEFFREIDSNMYDLSIDSDEKVTELRILFENSSKNDENALSKSTGFNDKESRVKGNDLSDSREDSS
ncbi:hypothetical protein [Methanobrevibacter ruminantium]|uniref:hypothetical protein n=1 Tax=Methanobrevibacter ruminantium TaxID=83816 RepID=UPI0026F12687|nr:hypothetical protein [Methanobrevibacter ruminantium]